MKEINNENSIGKIISKLRKDKGLTQAQLAEKLNVSDKAVSKWEQDRGTPSIEFLPIIAKFFNVSIDYLMTNKKENELSDMAKKSLDNKKEIQFNIEDYLEEGILDINKLLKTRNLKFIKESLNNNPIHYVELLSNMRSGDKKKFFEFAVDKNLKELATLILRNELTDSKFEKVLASIWVEKNIILNKEHFFIYNENNSKKDFTKIDSYLSRPMKNIFEKLSLCRERIIKECSLKYDKEKILDELSIEYFEEQLRKENLENVIIKLCVRLESILHCDFRYEGEFSEILKKYCDKELTWTQDDGWGYNETVRDEKTITLLNKLRMKRNNIVHSERTPIEMSLDEIEYCVEYICKMG